MMNVMFLERGNYKLPKAFLTAGTVVGTPPAHRRRLLRRSSSCRRAGGCEIPGNYKKTVQNRGVLFLKTPLDRDVAVLSLTNGHDAGNQQGNAPVRGTFLLVCRRVQVLLTDAVRSAASCIARRMTRTASGSVPPSFFQ